MNKTELRFRLHHLVDKLEDIDTLNLMHEVFSGLAVDSEKDIIDELTGNQKERLERSLKQAAEGRVIPDVVMRERIKQWLIK
ncbi:MAG TPA: hypothetical protein VEC12_12905 [Bacteroidia bacterium]|nr:hypothetical protein [Bacteroidia bacterium]